MKDHYIQELLDEHKKSLDAHLQKDISFFTSNISENVLNVSNGEIYRPSKDDIHQRFSNYLSSTEFTKYEDISDPIVQVSDDGTLGWVIANVEIKGVRKMPDGSEAKIDSVWAWINLYKRENNIWIRQGNLSTMKPPSS